MNENRRKFLKIVFVGGGALLAEKILTPLFSFLASDSSAHAETDPLKETNLGNFLISEDKKRLSVYDNSGEEIFQIDKEA